MTVSWERIHEAEKRQMRRANSRYHSEQMQGTGVSISNSNTPTRLLEHTRALHPSTHVSPHSPVEPANNCHRSSTELPHLTPNSWHSGDPPEPVGQHRGKGNSCNPDTVSLRVRGLRSCEPEQKPDQPAAETSWGLMWGFLRLSLAAAQPGAGAPAVPQHCARPPCQAWHSMAGMDGVSTRHWQDPEGKPCAVGGLGAGSVLAPLACPGFLWAGGHGSMLLFEIKARAPLLPPGLRR